jgi:hypothetical protein
LSGKIFHHGIIPNVSRVSTVLIPTTLRLRQEEDHNRKALQSFALPIDYNAWAIAFESQGHLQRLNARLQSIHAGSMSPMLFAWFLFASKR